MLTISSGTRSASASASSVLPHAVGPVMQTHSTPAVSLTRYWPRRNSRSRSCERDQSPRRPAVIARLAALGALHLAQQRVHLLERQAPVRAHGRVAGHRREQLVAQRLDAPRALPVGEIAQARRAPAARRRCPRAASGTARTATCCGPRRTTSSPTAASSSPSARRDPPRAPNLEAHRHQQRLRLQALRGQRRLEPLVGDALVRRVHVDDDQAARSARARRCRPAARARSPAAVPPPRPRVTTAPPAAACKRS